MISTLIGFIMFLSINLNLAPLTSEQVISEAVLPLDNRQPVPFVNEVFKDNILLSLSYLRGQTNRSNINWDEVKKPFHYQFTLKPNETFAFHEDALSQYKVAKNTGAHFNYSDGFKSDGYLMGDGVCHLASLFYLAAKRANLEALAPTNHNFAVIPDISKEYGVAIFYSPGQKESNARQNLYITNNKDNPVTFNVDYSGKNLKVMVKEDIKILDFD